MRLPTYLSYSSFSLFEKNVEEFYLKHLADTRPSRVAQERPASVGSAFDAYVKSSFHEVLFGKGADPKYTLDALLEAQVEPHNRDWARVHGKHIFESYKVSGRYDELLGLLKQSVVPPRMEFDVKVTLLGVPLLCKPDLYFILPDDLRITHDFKVNGYCAKSGVSPNKGYMICMDGFKAAKQNKSHGKSHGQYKAMEFKGLTISEGCIEDCDAGWADQLSMYSWSLDTPIESDYVLSIDQLVSKPVPEGDRPIRVASYRGRVRKSYQKHLAERLKKCWEVVKSGHIFTDLSREESDERCKLLDGQGGGTSSGSEYDAFFNEAVRAPFRG